MLKLSRLERCKLGLTLHWPGPHTSIKMKSILLENDAQESQLAESICQHPYTTLSKSTVKSPAVRCKALLGRRSKQCPSPYKVFIPLTKEQTLSLQSVFAALYILEGQLEIVPGLPVQHEDQTITITPSIQMSSLMARRAAFKPKSLCK